MTFAPRSRRSLGIGALALAALLVAALLPRLWRFEAVGEGTDEAYSVTATRAMLEGRLSDENPNDITADQAKFTPVAEAAAVPFVAVLGDRPLSYRLPSLLATLATLALLATWLARRHGPWAVATLAALSVLDYRSLVYAQTHRYVAIEQMLLVGAFLFAVRAERTRRLAPAALAGALGLLAFHAHLLALLVLVPAAGTLVLAAIRSRGGVRRFPAHLPVLLLLAAEATIVLVLFRSHALPRLFVAPAAGEAPALAASVTMRMLGGQGLAAALLAIPGAVFLLRRRGFAERLAGAIVLGGIALFALGSLRYGLRPRYGLCLQPFLWIAAATLVGRAGPRTWAAGRLRLAVLTLLAAATSSPGGWYLATGAGRDAEAKALEVLRAEARPGDAVLYDTGFTDPFRRRPPDLPAFPRERTHEPGAEAALDAASVRWVLRSSATRKSPLYTASFVRRLSPVATVETRLLFQDPLVLTVSRLAPLPPR